ncbi:hypothetical protein BpHYR1_048432 [Brachionus plicatilis]|uniref:Uncharacterized protein n=1 Tax=Brachionus plicatilis TaxID=10195 RepID=A0A3M7SSL6_BRAPC|nr:hypothetical protein BpHYR1_048432 [Brachionus plicatilis]
MNNLEFAVGDSIIIALNYVFFLFQKHLPFGLVFNLNRRLLFAVVIVDQLIIAKHLSTPDDSRIPLAWIIINPTKHNLFLNIKLFYLLLPNLIDLFLKAEKSMINNRICFT